MQLRQNSTPINEWLNERAGLKFDGMSATRYLSNKTKLSTQSIYNYVEAVIHEKRDIRVTGSEKRPEIYEVRRLSK